MLALLARFIVSRPRSLCRLSLMAALGALWTYSAVSGHVTARSRLPSDEPARSAAPADDPYAANFEKGIGRVIIVPRWRSQFIQLIVEVDGLEDAAYEAFIEREDGKGGVTMGPANLQLAYGKRVTETMLVPTNGRLLAWYVCPERIVAGTRSRVILRRAKQPGGTVARSDPFEIRRPTGQ